MLPIKKQPHEESLTNQAEPRRFREAIICCLTAPAHSSKLKSSAGGVAGSLGEGGCLVSLRFWRAMKSSPAIAMLKAITKGNVPQLWL
jgi:hypothetical protein